MKRSLQRQLSLVLGSAILCAGLLAAIASFRLAYSEAKEFQDDMLRQIAAMSAGSAANSPASITDGQYLPDTALADPESRVTILHLPSDTRPDWLTGDLSAGLHTLNVGADHLRVFVRDGPAGTRTVVFQLTDARDEIAADSAWRTLIPLLLLLPVLAWLIVRIIRHELAPVTLLAKSLDEQPADHLHPLADHDIPREIAPFVHAINRLLGRVNHLVAQQRRFIADAAHELRSPLTALSLQAQNLRQADTLEAVQTRVTPLQAGIERARQLTEQLLTLARTQAETQGEVLVDVPAMARALIAEYLPMAEAKHIDLGLEEVTRLQVRASPDTLPLILKNALENALKYTPENGVVTLRLLSDADSAVIEVVDNGPGIPAPERERVFDAFYRMPDSSGQGSGLGLAIAREAAVRSGGVVSLHDRGMEPGTVFRYRQRFTR
ncbi:MAG: two-component sensor histidine kinase [Gallionella sp.]|nr:two-component sensor histidine kinase [Gallionella sp.]